MHAIAPFRITVCGMDELDGYCESGASHVLSILDPGWPVPQAFGAFGEHLRLDLRFHDVLGESGHYLPPEPEHVMKLLALGRDIMAEPPADVHLLVHCHAGISRSTAAITLILAQALPNRPAREILDEVSRIRPKAWPNLALIEIGDRMLLRGGEIVAATAEVYRRQLEIKPELAETLEREGRGREIAAARALKVV